MHIVPPATRSSHGVCTSALPAARPIMMIWIFISFPVPAGPKRPARRLRPPAQPQKQVPQSSLPVRQRKQSRQRRLPPRKQKYRPQKQTFFNECFAVQDAPPYVPDAAHIEKYRRAAEIFFRHTPDEAAPAERKAQALAGFAAMFNAIKNRRAADFSAIAAIENETKCEEQDGVTLLPRCAAVTAYYGTQSCYDGGCCGADEVHERKILFCMEEKQLPALDWNKYDADENSCASYFGEYLPCFRFAATFDLGKEMKFSMPKVNCTLNRSFFVWAMQMPRGITASRRAVPAALHARRAGIPSPRTAGCSTALMCWTRRTAWERYSSRMQPCPGGSSIPTHRSVRAVGPVSACLSAVAGAVPASWAKQICSSAFLTVPCCRRSWRSA